MAIAGALDLLGACDAQAAPQAFGAAYLEALRPLGATSLWARSFSLTRDWIDPKVNAGYRTEDHVRIRAAAWQGSAAQRYADTVCPLARGAALLQKPFFASAVAPHASRAYRDYWSAMGEFGVRDTLAVPHFGPNNSATALTVWFAGVDLSPAERDAVMLSSVIAMHLLRPAGRLRPDRPLLTPRERDCLSYVADGLSDQAIADRLGIGASTAHAHVENAKRKLAAKTRAQAVARAFARGELLLP